MTRGLEGKVRFLKNSENKDLEFIIADQNNSGSQIKETQLMYVRGGNTRQLVGKIRKTSILKEHLDGKTIGISSAVVYFLCKYYWENDNSTLGDGLGIFNVKALCHYRPEDTAIIKQLLAYKENLPLLTLPNHKWIIVYISRCLNCKLYKWL